MKHKLLSLFVALIATTALFAGDVIIVIDSFRYKLDTDEMTAEVYGVERDHPSSITIPSLISYKSIPFSVTSIGKWAFEGCSGLTSVTIGNSVTTIGDAAFCGCKGLTSVTIGNSVTSIGGGAFRDCSALASVTIPNSVTTIGESAFEDCTGLTSVTIGNSVTAIGRFTFYECTGLTSVTIGNSVTTIGEFAFYGCSGLTSVTIPNSVTTIEDYAFCDCSGMTSVTIGNSVTTIGYCAFCSYQDLTSVKCLKCFAKNPPICGEYAFCIFQDNAKVYVPSSSLSAYQSADVWKDLPLFPLGAEEVPIVGNDPIVSISNQDVTIIWPITNGAKTYTLVITKGDEVVCVLVFTSNGHLIIITFAAPGRDGARQAPAATLTAQGYQFTVTGLDPDTDYSYSVTAADEEGKTLAEHKGNFSTTGGGTPTSMDDVQDSQGTIHKYFHNGNLIIERNGVKYTPAGQKVK